MTDRLPVSPTTWLRKSKQGSQPPFAGQSVPCGTCTACCHNRVVLYPNIGDRVESYGTTTEADGTITLTRHADGTCLYMHEERCLIYDRRPFTCRQFDCRALLVADVEQPAAIRAAAEARFVIALKAPDDLRTLTEIRMKARLAEVMGKTPSEQLQEAFT